MTKPSAKLSSLVAQEMHAYKGSDYLPSHNWGESHLHPDNQLFIFTEFSPWSYERKLEICYQTSKVPDLPGEKALILSFPLYSPGRWGILDQAIHYSPSTDSRCTEVIGQWDTWNHPIMTQHMLISTYCMPGASIRDALEGKKTCHKAAHRVIWD